MSVLKLPLAVLATALGLGACAQLPDAAQSARPAPISAAAIAAAMPAVRQDETALPYAGAVAARFPAPAQLPDLPSLAAGRQAYTSPQELKAWLDDAARRAAAAGSQARRLQPGQAQSGQAIEALRLSRGPGRPLVLLIGQQHGDEPAGAEALLLIARQLADGPLSAVLDKVDVLLVPRANPDGAASARRVTDNGVDMNRDHLLLRTPEAQALAALARTQRPLVVVDAHEHTVAGRYLQKFGAIQRNDMLLQYAMTANLPLPISQASETWFRQPIIKALAAQGMSTEWYYTNPTAPDDLRLAMGGVQPDTGRNVNGLRNAVSLLLESRGVGIGRLHLARRVQSQVVALATVLRQAALHAPELVRLQAEADAALAAQACTGPLVVQAAATPTRRELLMLDPATGADKPVAVAWESALDLRVLRERPRPCGYWLAADQQAAVATLQALGVVVQRFAEPAPLHAQAWIERSRLEMARPDVRGSVDNGSATIQLLQVELQDSAAPALPGSFYVSLAQPLAGLVTAAMEPDTQNSFVANRLLPTLDKARRVLALPSAAALVKLPAAVAVGL